MEIHEKKYRQIVTINVRRIRQGSLICYFARAKLQCSRERISKKIRYNLLRKIYVQAGLRGPVYLLLPKFAWSCTILCFFLLRSRPNTHRRTKLNITRNWVSASCYIERCTLFLGIGVINWGEWNRFVIRFRPSPFKYFAIHNKTNKRRETIN